MTVVYRADEHAESFNVKKLLNVDQALVRALVRELLVGGTEAAIEQLTGHQELMEAGDLSRQGIQDYLREVPENAEVFIEDVLYVLLSTVKHNIRVANYGAAVTGIKYGLAGDIKDVEVDVTVTW